MYIVIVVGLTNRICFSSATIRYKQQINAERQHKDIKTAVAIVHLSTSSQAALEPTAREHAM